MTNLQHEASEVKPTVPPSIAEFLGQRPLTTSEYDDLATAIDDLARTDAACMAAYPRQQYASLDRLAELALGVVIPVAAQNAKACGVTFTIKSEAEVSEADKMRLFWRYLETLSGLRAQAVRS